jgi:hypothetical protein
MWISLCRSGDQHAQVPVPFRVLFKLVKKYSKSAQFFYIQLLTDPSGSFDEMSNVNIAESVTGYVRKSLIRCRRAGQPLP